ncbi:hypothetical protein [Burkholderia cepacia]|uniref:hypothetical protein n=1 Tax=Burkholderia cepacia TaxID=292 RepID=UPI001CF40423|nr:hypothetical protein [Burkholderia cepacia]MCA8328523.1 hypothetical protein [Burkholderia cepacia]
MKTTSPHQPLRHIKLPFPALSEFTDEEIYSLNMLGHMYNETMALSKLIYISKGNAGDPKTIRSGSMFHAIFFSRLHAGKLHEAHSTINNNRHIALFLKQKCFPLMENNRGQTLLKKFNQRISQCKWLTIARNQDAMHFGTFEQFSRGVDLLKKNEIGFEFIEGELAMDTLFISSNIMTALSFFHRAHDTDWHSGLENLIDDLNSIQDSLMDLINETIHAITQSNEGKSVEFNKRVKKKDIKSFQRNNVHDYQLPYFFVNNV